MMFNNTTFTMSLTTVSKCLDHRCLEQVNQLMAPNGPRLDLL